MVTKIKQKNSSDYEIKEELNKLKSEKRNGENCCRLIEITKQFASEKQWNESLKALQFILDEKERNLLIADIIEGYLLPANETAVAKKFAKYLANAVEIEPFVSIRICLAENDTEKALKIARGLPSPLSRNFAFLHIMECYLDKKEKNKVNKLCELLKDNIKTIYEHKSRCYILRELALNLFLPNHDKEHAKEFAMLIPDEKIKKEVLNKISKYSA